ncbi:DUF6537 domain-containing protein [Methylacidiphilum caldifontis]|uniref:DUF6537 domain-containing protein n=1 Tax=Methylacidiphilum caldifontis TaxID=2795386 RepID=UPI001F5E144B|nr:DUF6537 domain-containing protein [Methylacidiphilum caldifontis]
MATKSVIAAADPRFLKEEGLEVYTGNEAIVKGLLETHGGIHLITGYPGSPISGIFDTVESISGLLKEHGIQAILANNEALAAAMLNGSQMAGLRAVAAMKSVGFHVASDGLALGNLGGSHPEGGAIVIIGDDPWNDSTQTPADSRFLCKHLHMPILEPSTIQEIKDWVNLGFILSRYSNLFIGYLVTTNQADGGGTVMVKKNHFPLNHSLNAFSLDSSTIDFEKRVILPPRTSQREKDFLFRYQLLWSKAKELQLDKTYFADQNSKIGFVCSGLSFCYLAQALDYLGVYGKIPILKVGLTYPLNPQVIVQFAQTVDELYVIEERRAFLEESIVLILNQERVHKKIYGKRFPLGLGGIPSTGGLDPSLLVDILDPLLSKISLSGKSLCQFNRFSDDNPTPSFQLPLRTPTFCPGCPHRDSAALLLEIQKNFKDPHYMKIHHKTDPIDLVFHGDTGCYTMLMFEPYQSLMHNYSGMGLGGGTGLGIDPFIKNKQVVFMGDSTFFHSGLVAISNSVKNGQDITYIILDNRTTAMTGHQTTPGVDKDLLGDKTACQDINKIIAAITEKTKLPVYRINPSQREQYKIILEQTILKEGVKIIIAEKECAIISQRRQTKKEREEIRQKGYISQKKYVFINPDVCEFCLECTMSTGCPGLTFIDTDFGKKMATDLSWCVADGACARVGACPAFAELTVFRSSPRSHFKEEPIKIDIPPQKDELKKPYRVLIAGVGGMGIASLTAVIVRAAHRDGFCVQFCDRNGLAIRNGSVVSQIVFYQKPNKEEDLPITPIGNYGEGDLILGLDPLETARIIDPGGRYKVGDPEKTALILNETLTQTVRSLIGKDTLNFSEIESKILSKIDQRRYLKFPFSQLSEEYFDNKLYSNLMAFGVAFQAGYLPFSLESIEWAIQETLGKKSPINIEAFSLGRALVVNHKENTFNNNEKHTEQLLFANPWDSFIIHLQKSKKEEAQKLWKWHSEISSFPLDKSILEAFSLRLKNIYLYEDIEYAQLYYETLKTILTKDCLQLGFAATKAAIKNIYKIMAIKDEVEVARLLTDSQTLSQNLQLFHIQLDKGDRVEYKHWTKPEFVLGNFRIRFRLKSSPWMLKIMSKAKFLRRILPGWHKREKEFRDWFLYSCKQFEYSNSREYQLWVEFFELPEAITGYREVRYPKMEKAKERALQILAEIKAKDKERISLS